MIARHEANIRNIVDEVYAHGYAKVSKDLLVKVWYGQDRMSKNIWKDIISKLPEDMNAEDYQVFEWNDDILIIEKACCTALEVKAN